MPLTLDLPADVEENLRAGHPELEREALVAVALDLFRLERVTLHEFGRILGMTRLEADAFLAARGEYAQTATPEEMESDFQYLVGQFAERSR